VIVETVRERIEKYITGIVNNHDSKMYAIYANPEHVHFLASRSPKTSEEVLATIVQESSENFIHRTAFFKENFDGKILVQHSPCQNLTWIRYINTF